MNALSRTMIDLAASLRQANDQPRVLYRRLASLLDYSPETGEFRWKKRSGDDRSISSWNARYAGKVAGSLNQIGYRQIRIDGRQYCAHKLAWLFVDGKWPTGELDHINRCRDDNRIDNLRPATRAQNCANTRIYRTNKSGYRGVSRKRNGWEANIRKDGKRYNLGFFKDKEEAAAAYDRAAIAVHGDFCPPLTSNDARTTQPVFITKKTYSNGHVFYEVLVGGEYYSDVDERELALLQAGMEPSDLGLDPVEGE